MTLKTRDDLAKIRKVVEQEWQRYLKLVGDGQQTTDLDTRPCPGGLYAGDNLEMGNPACAICAQISIRRK